LGPLTRRIPSLKLLVGLLEGRLNALLRWPFAKPLSMMVATNTSQAPHPTSLRDLYLPKPCAVAIQERTPYWLLIMLKEEFPHFPKDMSHKLQISLNIFEFSNGNLLSLRSQAHAMTLIGIRRWGISAPSAL